MSHDQGKLSGVKSEVQQALILPRLENRLNVFATVPSHGASPSGYGVREKNNQIKTEDIH